MLGVQIAKYVVGFVITKDGHFRQLAARFHSSYTQKCMDQVAAKLQGHSPSHV